MRYKRAVEKLRILAETCERVKVSQRNGLATRMPP